MEEGLNKLPYKNCSVTTPTGKYTNTYFIVVIISIYRWKKEKKQDYDELMDTLRLSYTKNNLGTQTSRKQGIDNIVLTGYKKLANSENDTMVHERIEMNSLSPKSTDMIRNDALLSIINVHSRLSHLALLILMFL